MESRSRISLIDKKLIVIILLEIICVLLCLNLYTQVSAKALITKYKNNSNIKNELTVISNVTILDNKEELNFNVVTNANNTNYLNIKNPKLEITKSGYILRGKIAISDVLTFSNSSELKNIEYYFDKNENLISGKIELNNALDNDIINIISSNVLNSNENLSVDDINNSIKCNSKSVVYFSISENEVVDEVFNVKLIEQLKTMNTSNTIDKNLLNIKIDDKEYILNESKIDEAKDTDTVYKKDNIIYYLNNNIVYGVSGKIENINFNGIKSLDDLKKSLGEPTNTIKDTSYWEIKDVNNTLYITYSKDYIEIMYK